MKFNGIKCVNFLKLQIHVEEFRIVTEAGFDFFQGKIAPSQFFLVDSQKGFVKENAGSQIRVAFVECIEKGVFRFAVLALGGQGLKFL